MAKSPLASMMSEAVANPGPIAAGKKKVAAMKQPAPAQLSLPGIAPPPAPTPPAKRGVKPNPFAKKGSAR